MTDRVRLYIIIDDQPTLALSIPLNICTTLSLRPLKWLRFLGYAIYGQKGHLSLSQLVANQFPITLQPQADVILQIECGPATKRGIWRNSGDLRSSAPHTSFKGR